MQFQGTVIKDQGVTFALVVVNEYVITSFISDTYFIDIGIPKDYNRAFKELPGLAG